MIKYSFTLTEEELNNLVVTYLNEYHDLQYHYSNFSSGYCHCFKDWVKALNIDKIVNKIKE